MKTLRRTLLIFAVLLLIPASSFALVDISIFGGRTFGGDIDLGSIYTPDLYDQITYNAEAKKGIDSLDLKGYEYGVVGHVNMGIPYVLTVGIGPFMQINSSTFNYKYDLYTSKEYNAKRTTYGLDGYFQLDFPIIPFYPYVKGGIALKEEAEIEYDKVTSYALVNPLTSNPYTSIAKNLKEEYFKSYYYGAGLAKSLFDLVALDIQIFVEYVLTKSKQEDDVTIEGHAVRGGLRVSI